MSHAILDRPQDQAERARVKARAKIRSADAILASVTYENEEAVRAAFANARREAQSILNAISEAETALW